MTASGSRLIDIHCHYSPAAYPTAPDEAAARRWPCMCMKDDERGLLKFGDKPFRKLDSRSWSVERRLEDMESHGVSVQVLSPMPELLSYWLEPDATGQLHQYINGGIAELAARHADRFWGLGAVPLQDIPRAIEMLPSLKQCGLYGVEVGSNVNGRYLGEAEFEPFFEAAAELDLAVFVHALHPLQAKHLATFPDLVAFAGFPTDTGLCAATLLMSGVLERHPNLRIGFSHGGGALAPIVHRMEQGWRSTKGFGGKLAASPALIASKLYVDCLVYDVGYARHLEGVAPGRVCLGTDYPYEIMQQRPYEFVAQVAKNQSSSIWASAAERFLLGAAAQDKLQ